MFTIESQTRVCPPPPVSLPQLYTKVFLHMAGDDGDPDRAAAEAGVLPPPPSHVWVLVAAQVSARETARIPIVSFHDPESGLDVDFCGVSNSLAIRNTALLRTYAQVDRRVVPLAMFVKNWCVLETGKGELGSVYVWGGILCSIVHSQWARPPIAAPDRRPALPPTRGLSRVVVPTVPCVDTTDPQGFSAQGQRPSEVYTVLLRLRSDDYLSLAATTNPRPTQSAGGPSA